MSTSRARCIRRSVGICVMTLAATLCIAMIVAPPLVAADSGTRTLYLIRHGHYKYSDTRDPEVGKALTPLGVAQARMVAARLRSLPVSFSGLYSSTMTRARETAKVIGADLGNMDVIQSRLLSECVPPAREKDVVAKFSPDELTACREKLDGAFAEFFVPSPQEDRHDIVVCHGNVIRYFVMKVLKTDPMLWLSLSAPGHCSLTIVRVNPDGKMTLLALGDVGHIPHNLQSGSSLEEPILIVPDE
jgi:serine/threonine-protein phosphatase PGAM5